MNYRTILSIGFVLLCSAVLIHSLNSANAGPSVSTGTNPIFSFGGVVSSDTSTVFTAPSDQMMIITDVVLTMNSSSCTARVNLETASGNISNFKLHSNYVNNNGWGNPSGTAPTVVAHSFRSGIPVLVGDSLQFVESGGCSVAYSLSGYYAHP